MRKVSILSQVLWAATLSLFPFRAGAEDSTNAVAAMENQKGDSYKYHVPEKLKALHGIPGKA
jgi:hypothetical protein